ARGEHVAVKVVPKSAKTRYRKLRTELKILRRIRSHHVVRFYEYFSIDDSVWIVYEFMGRGSITDLLAGYPEIRMPAITISYVMHEVLTALAYLHERHIIHCDLRSDNVLIDDNGKVKLADFSSAVYLEADQASAQKSSLGAIYWMAPELARGAGYSPSTDAWAAGSLLYEMLEGQPPYIEYPDIKVLELSHTNGMPKLNNPDACDPSLIELMHLCTAIAPSERPPAARLRKH
ncbi:kinase-like protein, partial [Coemansia reversa NRRL 1564]